MTVDQGIPLAQAIEDLRSELLKAVTSGKGQALQFRLKPVVLELKLAITREDGVNASVNFSVLRFGAEASGNEAMTHTLKLELEPVGKDGESEFLINEIGVAQPA